MYASPGPSAPEGLPRKAHKLNVEALPAECMAAKFSEPPICCHEVWVVVLPVAICPLPLRPIPYKSPDVLI